MPDITIHLHCGTHTCAKHPGSFCDYLGTIKMGTLPVCRLFPTPNNAFTELHENSEGWLLRCEACISAEMDDKTVELRQRLHDLEVSMASANPVADL